MAHYYGQWIPSSISDALFAPPPPSVPQETGPELPEGITDEDLNAANEGIRRIISEYLPFEDNSFEFGQVMGLTPETYADVLADKLMHYDPENQQHLSLLHNLENAISAAAQESYKTFTPGVTQEELESDRWYDDTTWYRIPKGAQEMYTHLNNSNLLNAIVGRHPVRSAQSLGEGNHFSHDEDSPDGIPFKGLVSGLDEEYTREPDVNEYQAFPSKNIHESGLNWSGAIDKAASLFGDAGKALGLSYSGGSPDQARKYLWGIEDQKIEYSDMPTHKAYGMRNADDLATAIRRWVAANKDKGHYAGNSMDYYPQNATSMPEEAAKHEHRIKGSERADSFLGDLLRKFEYGEALANEIEYQPNNELIEDYDGSLHTGARRYFGNLFDIPRIAQAIETFSGLNNLNSQTRKPFPTVPEGLSPERQREWIGKNWEILLNHNPNARYPDAVTGEAATNQIYTRNSIPFTQLGKKIGEIKHLPLDPTMLPYLFSPVAALATKGIGAALKAGAKAVGKSVADEAREPMSYATALTFPQEEVEDPKFPFGIVNKEVTDKTKEENWQEGLKQHAKRKEAGKEAGSRYKQAARTGGGSTGGW